MAFDMVKFERGQVWKVRFNNPFEQRGSEQSKDRPWLVLSVGVYNHSSGMITAVPLSTRTYTKTPAQVLIKDSRDLNSVILCEQIRSFDTRCNSYEFEYIGNLSSEVLEKVDVALSIHLGLHYSPITLKSLYDSMEAIIKSVGHMQRKSDTPKFSDADVRAFANKLAELAGNNFDSTENETEDSTSDPVIVEPKRFEETVQESSDPVVEKSPAPKAKRIRWTPETCKEFLEDANNLPMKEVMVKWDIRKKMRFYSMKSYAEGIMKRQN